MVEHHHPHHAEHTGDDTRTSIVAIVAIICAIGSYIATFSASPIIGLLAALLAVGLGLVGLAISISPKVTGGIMSIIAIVLGIFGIGLAILGMVGVIIF